MYGDIPSNAMGLGATNTKPCATSKALQLPQSYLVAQPVSSGSCVAIIAANTTWSRVATAMQQQLLPSLYSRVP